MNIDVRAIAEEQNGWVARHWFDGLDLTLLGVPIGPVLVYNLLQVMGNQWLTHWEALEAAQAAAQDAPRKAAEVGSEGSAAPRAFGAAPGVAGEPQEAENGA